MDEPGPTPAPAGGVGCTCLGAGAQLHLVEPLGFSWTSASCVARGSTTCVGIALYEVLRQLDE